MRRSPDLKRTLAESLGTEHLQQIKESKIVSSKYYDDATARERAVEERWQSSQEKISRLEAALEQLKAEAENLREEEFDERYSTIQGELNELASFLYMAEGMVERFSSEFVSVEEIKSFEDFIERQPAYWMPRKREIGRLLAIAKQMHQTRVMLDEAGPNDPIRIVDIGGSNGFIGKLMVDLARENGLAIEYVVVDPNEKVVEEARRAYADEPMTFIAKTGAEFLHDQAADDPERLEKIEEINYIKKRFLKQLDDLRRIISVIGKSSEIGPIEPKKIQEYSRILSDDFDLHPSDIIGALPHLERIFVYQTRRHIRVLTAQSEHLAASRPVSQDLTINSWMPPHRDFTDDIRGANGAAIVYVIETWGATGVQTQATWTSNPELPWEEDSYGVGNLYEEQIAWVGHSRPQLEEKVYNKDTENRDCRAFSNSFLVQTRRDYSTSFSQKDVEPEAMKIQIQGEYPWEGRLEELTEGLSPTLRIRPPSQRQGVYNVSEMREEKGDYHEDLIRLIEGIRSGRIDTIRRSSIKHAPEKTETRERPKRYSELLQTFKHVRRFNPDEFNELVGLFSEMAEGKDPDGSRAEHLQDWQDEDFKDFLYDLENS